MAWQSASNFGRCPRRNYRTFHKPCLLEELEHVLAREKFLARLTAASVTVQDLVTGYGALATVIEAEAIAPVILVDPDDDAVLSCALAADAEVIVSGDSDLLGLKKHEDIRILTATEFLVELAL